jgi:hypothetical protein
MTMTEIASYDWKAVLREAKHPTCPSKEGDDGGGNADSIETAIESDS